jgi:hypothetical protein
MSRVVGLLSDSHSRWERTKRALEALRIRGASTFIHCGDVEDALVLDQLAGMDAHLQATEPLGGNGYDQARGLPRDFSQALAHMAGSAVARQLLGDTFVTGFCAVKALEHDSYLNEISAWERRYLLPLV